jgi:hypothetical protein
VAEVLKPPPGRVQTIGNSLEVIAGRTWTRTPDAVVERDAQPARKIETAKQWLEPAVSSGTRIAMIVGPKVQDDRNATWVSDARIAKESRKVDGRAWREKPPSTWIVGEVNGGGFS